MEEKSPPQERRLTAILSADVAGYSRMMSADEHATVRALKECRDFISRQVDSHRGRIFGTAGDGVIAEFPSAVQAVECAVEIQRDLAERNVASDTSQSMQFRIGVNLGDVLIDGDDLLGDGVNVAARLESLAEPGGICLSGSVYEQVRDRLKLHYENLGEQRVKNIPRPVSAYRVRPGGQGAARGVMMRQWRPLRAVIALAALVLVAIAVASYLTWPRPLGLILDLSGVLSVSDNPALPDKPSIAVLPFENMSGDPQQEYFSDGMTEDLITDLSRSPQLFVIARNSTFTYKGRPVNVERVGRELGVRYVVEGSVRRQSDRIRVTAQLIDATTGFHLWSERYDRDLRDMFTLQADLAREIQNALQVEIRDAEMYRVRRPETTNIDAYDALLRGFSHLERYRKEENQEARRWFQQAFTLDPSFASAHAMYAVTHNIEYVMGWNRDPRLLEVSEQAARRALELEIRSADGWNALAGVHLARSEYEAAREATEKAIAIEPSHDVPHLLRAIALMAEGQVLASLSSLQQSLRLNPRGPDVPALALVKYSAGKFDEAVEILEGLRATNPDNILARLILLHYRDSIDDSDEARVLAGEVLAVNPALSAKDADSILVGIDALDALRRAGFPSESGESASPG